MDQRERAPARGAALNRAGRRRVSHQGGRNGAAHRSVAALALTAGDFDKAESLFTQCLQADPSDLAALHDLGVVAARRGQPAQAVVRFERLLGRDPHHVDALLNMALALGDAGRPDAAADAARRAIALRPRDPNVHTVLAHVLVAAQDLAGAAAASGQALALDPAYAPAHLRRAQILRDLDNIDGSLASCEALIRLRPGAAEGFVERGTTLIQAGRLAEAERAFRDALAREPGHASALVGLSRSLLQADDAERAISELERGMAEGTESARLHTLRGLLHQKQGHLQDALVGLRRAIELDPSDATAYLNLGNLFLKTERYQHAVLFSAHAAELKPHLVDAYTQLAEAHRAMGNQAYAITLLEHALGLAPDRLEIRWMACWARMHACEWHDYAARIRDLLAAALAAGHTISPFMIMAFGLPDLETHLWTRAWAEETMPLPAVPPNRPDRGTLRAPDGRIRIGYLSADFRGHATAALVAELFRLQDRGRFELIGYNIGRDDGSELGRHMTAGLDRLVDVAVLDDRRVADRIAEDDIAILVDLKGFTTDSRPGILAYRPAPIQVNYLGYPGSMGTTLVDYIIADAVVAPFTMQPVFDEAIVHLPHSYQPNDRRRPGPDPAARRADHGLPETGFVFCCFNNNYKFTPLIFGIWMRLLETVPGSVLWLYRGNDLSATNLKAAAVAAGVDGDRLVFAPRAGYEQHLGRLGLADLFLDTLPVNAHTTASEALWCGVPVLTCTGSHFTSRVAASLLTAVGLPELITTDLAAYEREALALARDPARLRALRDRLAANRETAPLFDTPRYVRGFEAALERMVEIREAGQPPTPFAIADDVRDRPGRHRAGEPSSP